MGRTNCHHRLKLVLVGDYTYYFLCKKPSCGRMFSVNKFNFRDSLIGFRKGTWSRTKR